SRLTMSEADEMSIRVHIPTPMRQHTQGQAVVEVSGSTVQSALDDLGKKYDGISQRVFENGQVRRFVNVYLNDDDIRYGDNLAQSEEHTSELQSPDHLVCRLLLEKKKNEAAQSTS